MPPQVNVTSDIRPISDLLTLAFRDSPVTVYIVRSPDSTWPVSGIPLDLLGPKMIDWTTYKQSMGGELVEADNFAAAAIWYVSSDFFHEVTLMNGTNKNL